MSSKVGGMVGYGQYRNVVAAGLSRQHILKVPMLTDPTLPRYGTDRIQVRYNNE